MFCINCGNPIDGTAKFCTKCGARVEDEASQQPQTQTQPQQTYTPQQAQQSQQYQQSQPSAYTQQLNPVKPKFSKFFAALSQPKNLIITVISAVVVIVLVVCTCVWYFRSNNNSSSTRGANSNPNAAGNAFNNASAPKALTQDDIISKAGKAYKNVIDSGSYTSTNFPQHYSYYYALWDIDGDNIPEMVVTASEDFNIGEDQYIHVFSYKNGKIVSYPDIIDKHDIYEERGTMFFGGNHDGIVVARSYQTPENDGVDGLPWHVYTYKINGKSFDKSTVDVAKPIEFKTKFTTGSLAGLQNFVYPKFVSVNDLTDINNLIDTPNLTPEQKKMNKTINEWLEKGYQVFSGNVKRLSAEEAYDYPGTTPNDPNAKDEVMKSLNEGDGGNGTFDIIALDQKRSGNGFCTGMYGGFMPSHMIFDLVSVRFDNSDKDQAAFVEKYAGKKIMVAARPGGYDGGNWMELPARQPTVGEIHLIKEYSE
ncbi:zinc ribbon domain-containing protein [Gardnerella greenwoodii]|uniref:zinc ribbon domain-containing protein n=1 Tax=Gardnerella greenwoodii TaxID=2914925 RepID=UPI0003052CF6|nr:zinc ribbon domain-containing protein [Gardnerella greenwoodii]